MTIKKYFNLPDVEYLFINSQTDPRLIYRGFSYNVFDVEDLLVSDYCDYCEECGYTDSNLNGFSGYVQNNTESIYNYLDNLESCGAGIPAGREEVYAARKFFDMLEKSLNSA